MHYRSDNRAPDQMRPVSIIPNYINTAEGSVLIELGNTRVICTASVEETVPAFLRNTGKGWIFERVRDAASIHADPHAARGDKGPAKRTHTRNSAVDWALTTCCLRS